MNSSAPDTPTTIGLSDRLSGVGVQLRRLVLGKSSLTLADQVVFSGTNFVVTILLGRWAGPESLGLYSLVFGVMIMTLTLHESLICLPYAIEFRKIPRLARRAYAGSTLVQSSVLAALATPVLMISGLTAWLTPVAGTSLGSALCVFALAAPMVVMRDFARRYSMAHLRPHIAIVIDGSVSLVQLSILAVLAWQGLLSAWTALGVLGIGSGVVAAAWLVAAVRTFHFRPRRYRRDLYRNWTLGRWVFSSQATSVLTAYTPYWLIAAMLGTSATGIFVGCVAIVLLSNPFILGMHNFLSPTISHAMANDGSNGIGKVVIESTLFLAGIMTLLCIVIALVGEQFTTAVYGSQFGGNNLTTFVYALSTLGSSTGMAVDRALWATNHPKASFVTGLVGLIVTAVACWIAIPPLGIVGGALGVAIGNFVTTCLRWGAFVQLGVVREVAHD